MKTIFQYLSLSLLIPAGTALADTPRQECLGRMTFDVPEEMQWAVYNADHTNRITEGGGMALPTRFMPVVTTPVITMTA
jgi:hypothetical protein